MGWKVQCSPGTRLFERVSNKCCVVSGLGYIVGAQMADLTGQWQWGLRVTPLLGILAVALMMVFLKEPVRGASEGLSNDGPSRASWLEDVGLLLKK